MQAQDRVLQLTLSTGATLAVRVIQKSSVPHGHCILIHGNPGAMEDWERVVPLLSDSNHLAVLDLPGFGASPNPPGADPLGLPQLAEHVLALAAALGWDQPVVVGHSHGAAVALAAAAAYPERVSALVLVSSLGAPAHPVYRLLAAPGVSAVLGGIGALLRRRSLRAELRPWVLRAFTDACSPEPVPSEFQQRVFAALCGRPETLRHMAQLAQGDPCAQVLKAAGRTSCPVSFLHGALDALVPPRLAENVHQRIVASGGTSTFVTLPNAGHMLPLFQAATVADAISRAVSSTPKGAAIPVSVLSR